MLGLHGVLVPQNPSVKSQAIPPVGGGDVLSLTVATPQDPGRIATELGSALEAVLTLSLLTNVPVLPNTVFKLVPIFRSKMNDM